MSRDAASESTIICCFHKSPSILSTTIKGDENVSASFSLRDRAYYASLTPNFSSATMRSNACSAKRGVVTPHPLLCPQSDTRADRKE